MQALTLVNMFGQLNIQLQRHYYCHIVEPFEVVGLYTQVWGVHFFCHCDLSQNHQGINIAESILVSIKAVSPENPLMLSSIYYLDLDYNLLMGHLNIKKVSGLGVLHLYIIPIKYFPFIYGS